LLKAKKKPEDRIRVMAMNEEWLDPAAVKSRLEKDLQELTDKGNAYDKKQWQAMNYSLMAGGKRIRPVLTVWTGLSLGADADELFPFAEALEMIHTYSLIHDDLPAMDNDDYRRGRLTNHKVFGEAAAILAGDGLLTYAFEVCGQAMEEAAAGGQTELLKRQARAVSFLAQMAGPSGMVSGQMVDLESEGRTIGLDELTYMEISKTSRLLEAALVMGGCLAGAGPEQIQSLEEAGEKLGLAFQIQDDILDVTGDEKELGKPTGSDEKEKKSTFVSLYGLEKARKEAVKDTEEALARLAFLEGSYGRAVRDLVKSLIDRRK
jgi:geranylgeranyl diphosphate synthase type II